MPIAWATAARIAPPWLTTTTSRPACSAASRSMARPTRAITSGHALTTGRHLVSARVARTHGREIAALAAIARADRPCHSPRSCSIRSGSTAGVLHVDTRRGTAPAPSAPCGTAVSPPIVAGRGSRAARARYIGTSATSASGQSGTSIVPYSIARAFSSTRAWRISQKRVGSKLFSDIQQGTALPRVPELAGEHPGAPPLATRHVQAECPGQVVPPHDTGLPVLRAYPRTRVRMGRARAIGRITAGSTATRDKTRRRMG